MVKNLLLEKKRIYSIFLKIHANKKIKTKNNLLFEPPQLLLQKSELLTNFGLAQVLELSIKYCSSKIKFL
jgi:hypothetical protein